MQHANYLALVDCNSFFASCEEVFQPWLKTKLVVVLSSNDGCVIARNKHAKAAGIKMGMPYFEAKPFITKHNGTVFSSNFTLYGDMSRRVMQILSLHCPKVAIYSIDEAFLYLDHIPKENLAVFAHQLRKVVLQWTGIPVSIGIAKTKTLAKLANDFAKKELQAAANCNENYLEGVCVLDETLPETKSLFAELPCNEIWGVATKTAQHLERTLNIRNIAQLAHANRALIRKHFGVTGERIVLELQGVSALDFDEIEPPRKSMCHSRSFGSLISDLPNLREAVATFTSALGTKLREHQLVAQQICVFLQTSPHRSDLPQHFPSLTATFPVATHFTPALVKEALSLLEKIYKKGYHYKKAGVLVLDLVSQDTTQLHLWESGTNSKKQINLMQAVDRLNLQYGSKTVCCAAALPAVKDEEAASPWRSQLSLRSPCYTTSFDDFLRVKL